MSIFDKWIMRAMERATVTVVWSFVSEWPEFNGTQRALERAAESPRLHVVKPAP